MVPRSLPAPALKLQDPRQKCNRNMNWSIEWAVAFLIDHLNSKNHPDAATALRFVRRKTSALHREGHGLEIPFRVFNTLSNALFAGHLKNAVYLELRRLHPDVSGATHTQGMGIDPNVKRISIYLNRDALQEASSRTLVGILIHHMIHAYFLVACGPQVEKETAYGRLNHGLHFGKIMNAINKISGLNGRPVSSLSFGHTLAATGRLFYDEHQYHQRKPHHRRRGNEKWYCSHCDSDVATLSENEIEKWYNSVCKPLINLPQSLRSLTVQIYNPLRHLLEQVPRAEATPSTKSFEFIHHNKSVLVPTAHVDNYYSVGRAFEKAGSRYLEINKLIEQDIFLRFLELLHTNNYGPDSRHLLVLGKNGPPAIKSPSTSEPYLLTDIQMYKMGVLMAFDELKGIALERMYRHGTTHEDPIVLLRALYADGEPDGELKAWTRKFLGKTPGIGDGDWINGASSGAEPSNLAKLECDLLGWKSRFYELLESSSALKYEVGKVKRELVASGLYAPSRVYGAVGPLRRTTISRPETYLGSPWMLSEAEMERRAIAAAATTTDPFLQRSLEYDDEYEDLNLRWGSY